MRSGGRWGQDRTLGAGTRSGEEKKDTQIMTDYRSRNRYIRSDILKKTYLKLQRGIELCFKRSTCLDVLYTYKTDKPQVFKAGMVKSRRHSLAFCPELRGQREQSLCEIGQFRVLDVLFHDGQHPATRKVM